MSLTPGDGWVRLHVVQGEHRISRDPQVVLTTILGSCVAACLRDPEAGIGGMNHFLLPEGRGEDADSSRRYGAYAMELLINDLLRAGARRERLEAKLFGGARMIDGLSDVGAGNAAFAERFLRDEGIPVTASSLGGVSARRLNFWPVSGRAQQRTVTQGAEIATLKQAPKPPPVAADGGSVELF